MANNIALGNADLLITDGGDNILLSESDRHEDVIEFRVVVKQLFSFDANIDILETFTSNIMQIKDFTRGL